jgi:HSP20 family molecular chaperone IbpA
MSGSERDDFDPKIIEEMVRMFEEMGMPIDKQTLRSMIDQVRDQFENLGIDPSRMAMSETKFELNSNPEEFRKHMESMLSGPQGLGEFLKNMGIDIQVKPTETEAEADVYVDDGQMHITIDISRHSDIDAGNIELSLTGGGEVLQLMRTTQLHPFKHYVLPQVAMGQPHWDLNNGILDITFDLQ